MLHGQGFFYYHECQNRLSLKLEYGDVAPRQRVVSKECFKHKGSTQQVTALSTVAFVSVLMNVFFTKRVPRMKTVLHLLKSQNNLDLYHMNVPYI